MDEVRILVINDDSKMCTFLSTLLKEEGYSVECVLKRKKGLKIAKKNYFDIIISDVEMLGVEVDGRGMMEKFKEDTPDTMVIVTAPHESFGRAKGALRLGAYDCMVEPFDKEEVLFTIKRGIEFRRAILKNKALTKTLEEQKVKLETKVRERTEELALIYRIGQEISSTLDLDKVLQAVVDKVSTTMNLEICSILLASETTGELSIKCAKGLNRKIASRTHLRHGEPISGWVFRNNQAILVGDIEKDPRFTRRNKERYYTHSFISVPLTVKGEPIGVININNKRSKEAFTEDDFRLIKEVAIEAAIAIENAKLFKSLQDVYLRTIDALTSAIDAKDHYTLSHSKKVTEYAVAIAEEMRLTAPQVEIIRRACQLHDLGKIGIHDYILTKPSKLTPKEWEEIKLHSLKGAEILEPLTFLNGVIELVRQHHEHYDGKGYPHRYKGEEIKLGARIMAVADAFDAMTTERPYRKAKSIKEAIEEIKRYCGTQFDPQVVEAFLRVIEKKKKKK